MASTKTAILEAAVKDCKDATKLWQDALEEQKEQIRIHNLLHKEWERRQGLYNLSKQIFENRCTPSCRSAQPGDVQKLGCHPLCLNWGVLNPIPIEPKLVQPDFGDFVCTSCNQIVDIDAVAGNNIDMNDAINLQMTCTANLEKQISDASSGSSSGSSYGAGSNLTSPVKQSSTATTTTNEDPSQKSNIWTYVIVGIILVILIIGILIAIYFFTGDDDTPIFAET